MADFSGEIHPLADAYPMMPADELAVLAASIAVNGLRQPIVLDTEGRLIDGRNRLAACEAAEVAPEFTVFDGDPLDYINDVNDNRRHLSTGQRAAATALRLVQQGKRQGGRWARGSLPEDSSGSASETTWLAYMAQAGRVYDALGEPGLIAVLRGGKSLNAAVGEAQQVKRDDDRRATLADAAPDLAAQVTDDDLPIAEAWATYQKRLENERRAEAERTEANRARFAKTAQAVHSLALITGDWMDEYDPDLMDATQQAAFTADRLTQARDHIEELLTWTKTT